MSAHEQWMKKTGGCAYPALDQDSMGRLTMESSGMTLRDYFAAKALPAILAQEDGGIQSHNPENHISATSEVRVAEMWAEQAYQIADAMLRERAK